MKGNLLIGGGFFTHEGLSLGDLITHNPLYSQQKISLGHLLNREPLTLHGDFVVLFGIKGLERILRKQHFARRKIISIMKNFFTRSLQRTMPLIVVDELSLAKGPYFSNQLMKFFSENFNLRCYLLREYLRTKNYPDWVLPFSLPSNSYPDLYKQPAEKKYDLFFQGNASSRDRLKAQKAILKNYSHKRVHFKVTYGGVHNTLERLTKGDFLEKLSLSHLCFSFSGSGYDCYRYQEIPSVGSVLVCPDYPLVIRNDYCDLVHCIKFKNVRDLKLKISHIIDSPAKLEELRAHSLAHFRSFHTSERRAKEFEFIVRSSVQGLHSAQIEEGVKGL